MKEKIQVVVTNKPPDARTKGEPSKKHPQRGTLEDFRGNGKDKNQAEDARNLYKQTSEQTKEIAHSNASLIYTERGIEIGNIPIIPMEEFDKRIDGIRLEPKEGTAHRNASLMYTEEGMELKNTCHTQVRMQQKSRMNLTRTMGNLERQ